MERELTAREVIWAGLACETRAATRRAQIFAEALYGPRATQLTCTRTPVPHEEHLLVVAQVLAFDEQGNLLPYDFSTTWWKRRPLPELRRMGEAQSVLAAPPDGAEAAEITRDDIRRGLGAAFPEETRRAMRDLVAQSFGIETLHTWHTEHTAERYRDPTGTLTWTFDLTGLPPLPYPAVMRDHAQGTALSEEEMITAGRERVALLRWKAVRAYACNLYGTSAGKVVVSEFSRYNDFTYDRNLAVSVFDGTGERLVYDLRLPFWRRFHFTEQEVTDYVKQYDPVYAGDYDDDTAWFRAFSDRANAALDQLAVVLLDAPFGTTPEAEETDVEQFDLTSTPRSTYPHLWLPENV